jgi:hypothetical protein
MAIITVRFFVGEDRERSLVKLYNKLMYNMDMMPQGAMMPLVKLRTIDDVPILAVTLWSNKRSSYELRRLAVEIRDRIKKINEILKPIGIRLRERLVCVYKGLENGSEATFSFSISPYQDIPLFSGVESLNFMKACEIDPGLGDVLLNAGLNSFADVSKQWLESIAHLINARAHRTKTSRIERLAFPVLGNLSIKEINSVDVMAALKPTGCIEKKIGNYSF